MNKFMDFFAEMYAGGTLLAIFGGIASVFAFIVTQYFGLDNTAVGVCMTAMFVGIGLGALGAMFS